MLNYKNALWFHAGRARTPGQPNHTDLISLLFITGSFGVWLAQQLRAASAAAARQTTPAAGASRGSISLVKNQAFPPFLFLRDVRRHPGLVYIPSLQDLSRLRCKKNLGVFCGFYSEGFPGSAGRARCVEAHAAGIPASWD